MTMKKILYGLGILVMGFIFVSSASAQSRFGKGQDSIDCTRYLSLYQQDYLQKNYDAAIVNWRKVMKQCPESSVNNIPRGLTMYQYLITKETNPQRKSALVDTLMSLYDAGIQSRPQNRGSYLASKAQDLMKYLPDDQAKILNVLNETMSIQKEATPPIIYASYMNVIVQQNKDKKITDEQLLEGYNKVSDYISAAIKVTPTEELAKARDMIDNSFALSPAATCDNLNKIYSEKYEANKNDIDFLKKLTYLLNRNECTDGQLFEKASEQQFALDPSSAAAYNMAKLFLKKENYDKAVEYFENAIQHATDSIDKASYYVQLGQLMLAKYSKYDNARRYALNASRLRPAWGEPYILIATAYAAGPKCGENDFQHKYIYWVIVDKLNKAKSVDPDCAAKVNPMITTYSQYFAKKEDAFFYDVKEGDTVHVGCWVNEDTKARFIN